MYQYTYYSHAYIHLSYTFVEKPSCTNTCISILILHEEKEQFMNDFTKLTTVDSTLNILSVYALFCCRLIHSIILYQVFPEKKSYTL